MSSSRSDRLGEQLRRDLSELIQFEVKDPRIGMVSITEVRVSRDLAYARIYVTRIGEVDARPGAIEALNNAAGWLRRELGRRLSIRATPKLSFFYDDSIENGAKMESLIDKLVADDSRRSDRSEDS